MLQYGFQYSQRIASGVHYHGPAQGANLRRTVESMPPRGTETAATDRSYHEGLKPQRDRRAITAPYASRISHINDGKPE